MTVKIQIECNNFDRNNFLKFIIKFYFLIKKKNTQFFSIKNKSYGIKKSDSFGKDAINCESVDIKHT